MRLSVGAVWRTICGLLPGGAHADVTPVAKALSSTADTVAAKTAAAAQYGGGSVALIGGLTANEVAALGGLGIGVAGLAMNWWFKREHLKIARRNAKPDLEE